MINEAYNIDCVEYMKTMPDKYFDLAVVDPPYGHDCISWGGERKYSRFNGMFDRYKRQIRRTGGSWSAKYAKKIIDWDVAPTDEYFKELFRVSKNKIIWGGNYFNLPPTRCFLIWRKTGVSEDFSLAMAEYAWTSFFSNAKVFECIPQGKANDKRFHPTQKPIELYSWIYRLYAKKGDKILDTHLGSGSSRIAAYFAGLDFYGCEIDKDYFDKSVERYERICNDKIIVNGSEIKQLKLF